MFLLHDFFTQFLFSLDDEGSDRSDVDHRKYIIDLNVKSLRLSKNPEIGRPAAVSLLHNAEKV